MCTRVRVWLTATRSWLAVWDVDVVAPGTSWVNCTRVMHMLFRLQWWGRLRRQTVLRPRDFTCVPLAYKAAATTVVTCVCVSGSTSCCVLSVCFGHTFRLGFVALLLSSPTCSATSLRAVGKDPLSLILRIDLLHSSTGNFYHA